MHDKDLTRYAVRFPFGELLRSRIQGDHRTVQVLFLVGQYTRIGGGELRFVEGFPESFTGLVHFLLDFPLILGHLVLDEHIRPVALFGILVVDQGIVEGIHVSGSFPDGGMHEDG